MGEINGDETIVCIYYETDNEHGMENWIYKQKEKERRTLTWRSKVK